MSKYRVKIIIRGIIIRGSDYNLTRYKIQRKYFGFIWSRVSSSVSDKTWAYETCEEMNTKYEVIREKI